MSPLTRIDLDIAAANGCQDPQCTNANCDTLFMGQKCHPGAGLDASYKRGSGVLVISCVACDRRITWVKVADQL